MHTTFKKIFNSFKYSVESTLHLKEINIEISLHLVDFDQLASNEAIMKPADQDLHYFLSTG